VLEAWQLLQLARIATITESGTPEAFSFFAFSLLPRRPACLIYAFSMKSSDVPKGIGSGCLF